MRPITGLAGLAIAVLWAGTAVALDVAPPGAAACSGCHPARAAAQSPLTRLVGRNPADIIAAMREFREGKRPATVMDRIARGFTEDEVKAIAAWYAAQKEGRP